MRSSVPLLQTVVWIGGSQVAGVIAAALGGVISWRETAAAAGAITGGWVAGILFMRSET